MLEEGKNKVEGEEREADRNFERKQGVEVKKGGNTVTNKNQSCRYSKLESLIQVMISLLIPIDGLKYLTLLIEHTQQDLWDITNRIT